LKTFQSAQIKVDGEQINCVDAEGLKEHLYVDAIQRFVRRQIRVQFLWPEGVQSIDPD
jgi:hypothetical protein